MRHGPFGELSLRAEGRTVWAIARQLELDRKTVRRALKQERWKAYEQRAFGGVQDGARAVLLRR